VGGRWFVVRGFRYGIDIVDLLQYIEHKYNIVDQIQCKE